MVEHEQKPQHKAFRVRSYEHNDHAAVIDVYTAAIHKCPDNIDQIQPHWQLILHAAVNGDLADIPGTYFANGGHFWVATSEREDGTGEDVVGMVAVKTDRVSGDAELVRMFVHPSHHRCGIGRLLVDALERWVVNEGLKRVWLSTATARRFYESIGYTYFQTGTHAVGFQIQYFEKQLV